MDPLNHLERSEAVSVLLIYVRSVGVQNSCKYQRIWDLTSKMCSTVDLFQPTLDFKLNQKMTEDAFVIQFRVRLDVMDMTSITLSRCGIFDLAWQIVVTVGHSNWTYFTTFMAQRSPSNCRLCRREYSKT